MDLDDPARTIGGQIPVRILAMLRTRSGVDRGPADTIAIFDCEVVGFRLRGCFLQVRDGQGYDVRPPQTAMTPAGRAVEFFSVALRKQITRIAAATFLDLQASKRLSVGRVDDRAYAMRVYARRADHLEDAALRSQPCAQQQGGGA